MLQSQQRQLCQSPFHQDEQDRLISILKQRLDFQSNPTQRLDNTKNRKGHIASNDGTTLCYLLAKLDYYQTSSTWAIEQLLRAKPKSGDEDAIANYFCKLLDWHQHLILGNLADPPIKSEEDRSRAENNLPYLKKVIQTDLQSAAYYLPQRQRLNLAGLSFKDKTFTGAYLVNTNLIGTRMIRVIWDSAVLGQARTNARGVPISGTTMNLHDIGACVFLNCRAVSDAIGLRFDSLAPHLHLRIQHDPVYCHLVQRTHFLYRLQSIATPLPDGLIEVNFSQLDKIIPSDYPIAPGNQAATERLHQQCEQLLNYFREMRTKCQASAAGSPERQQATDTLGSMCTALSVWDSVKTNIQQVSAQYSASGALAQLSEAFARTHDSLSYFTLPWAIEALSDMLADASDFYQTLGSAGLIMAVGMATNALLTQLGYRHSGTIAMIVGTITAGILRCMTTFSPGLAAMAALLSLGLVFGRQGLGALIKGVMFNQIFHYATDHAAFIISTTAPIQAFVQDYAIPRALQASMVGFYAIKLYQSQATLTRLPNLTERQTIAQAYFPLMLQQFIQASLLARHLGFACGIDIVQQLRGTISWVIFQIPGLHWRLEVPQNTLQKMLASFENQQACLAAVKSCPAEGAALAVKHSANGAMQDCLRLYHPADKSTISIHRPTGGWSFDQPTHHLKVSGQVFGSKAMWLIEGGDFPGRAPQGMYTPNVSQDFQAGLEKIAEPTRTAYSSGYFHADPPSVVFKKMIEQMPSAGNQTTASYSYKLPNTVVLDASAVAQAAASTYANMKYAFSQSYVGASWLAQGMCSIASRAACRHRSRKPKTVVTQEAYRQAIAFVRNQNTRRPAADRGAGTTL